MALIKLCKFLFTPLYIAANKLYITEEEKVCIWHSDHMSDPSAASAHLYFSGDSFVVVLMRG